MSIRSVFSNNNFRLFTTLYIILISQVIWSKTVRSPDLKVLWAKDQQNQPGAAIPDELIWNIINGIKGVEEVGKYIPGSRNSRSDGKIWKDPQSSLLIPTGVLTYAKRNPPPNHGEPRIKKHTGHMKIDFGPASAIGIYGQLGDWLKQLQIGSGGGKSWGGGKKYQQSTPAPTTWKSWTWPTTTKSADWNAWKWSPKVWTEQTTVPTCVTHSTDQPAWTPAVPKWTKPAPPAWKKKSWKKPPPPTGAPSWPEKWRPPQPSTWVPKVPTWSYPKKKGWTWKGKTTPPTPQTTQNPWAWNLWKGPKSTDATTKPVPNTPGPWIDVWTTAGWSDPWAQPQTTPSKGPWAWQPSTTTPAPQQPWKWAYDGPSNGGDNGPWKRENSKTSTEKYVTLWVDPELIP